MRLPSPSGALQKGTSLSHNANPEVAVGTAKKSRGLHDTVTALPWLTQADYDAVKAKALGL